MGPSVLVHPSTLELHEQVVPAAACNNTVNDNTVHTLEVHTAQVCNYLLWFQFRLGESGLSS